MKRRKIRDEADARTCIAAVRASGLAPRAWARSAGIDGRSLRAWTMNLAQRATPRKARPSRSGLAKPVQLVELVPARISRVPARYVVRVGAIYVEVDEHFDGATLRRLGMITSLVVPERRTSRWYLLGNKQVALAPVASPLAYGVSAAGRF